METAGLHKLTKNLSQSGKDCPNPRHREMCSAFPSPFKREGGNDIVPAEEQDRQSASLVTSLFLSVKEKGCKCRGGLISSLGEIKPFWK